MRSYDGEVATSLVYCGNERGQLQLQGMLNMRLMLKSIRPFRRKSCDASTFALDTDTRHRRFRCSLLGLPEHARAPSSLTPVAAVHEGQWRVPLGSHSKTGARLT